MTRWAALGGLVVATLYAGAVRAQVPTVTAPVSAGGARVVGETFALGFATVLVSDGLRAYGLGLSYRSAGGFSLGATALAAHRQRTPTRLRLGAMGTLEIGYAPTLATAEVGEGRLGWALGARVLGHLSSLDEASASFVFGGVVETSLALEGFDRSGMESLRVFAAYAPVLAAPRAGEMVTELHGLRVGASLLFDPTDFEGLDAALLLGAALEARALARPRQTQVTAEVGVAF